MCGKMRFSAAGTSALLLALILDGSSAFAPPKSALSRSRTSNLQSTTTEDDEVTYESSANAKNKSLPQTTDVIVIGSGLAGLSCASLLSHNQVSTTVLESHDTPGGAAHTWSRRGYHFESGPSLYSGFSMDRSPNPLKQIFQIIGEDCEWITYDRWGTVLPNGQRFAAKIGPEEFDDVLLEHGGPDAVMEC